MTMNSLRRSVVSLLQQAITDVQRGDRVGALDSIGMAQRKIRDSFPKEYPSVFTLVKEGKVSFICLNGKPLRVEDVLLLLRAKV